MYRNSLISPYKFVIVQLKLKVLLKIPFTPVQMLKMYLYKGELSGTVNVNSNSQYQFRKC